MVTLKQQFQATKSRKQLLMAALPATLVLLLVAWWLWPVPTLAEALRSIDKAGLQEPLRRQPFRDRGLVNWHWVDASRRTEMISGDRHAPLVDAMIRVAGGRPFLYHPLHKQAFIDRADGPVYVFSLGYGSFTAFARDAKGGPVLDLKPFKVTPEIVVIPVDRMSRYVRAQYRDARPSWNTFVTDADRERRGEARNAPFLIADPFVAMAFGRGRT